MEGQEGDHPITHDDVTALRVAAKSYAKYYEDEFSQEHDHFRLVGQDNIRKYLPVRGLCVRVHLDDSPFEIFARVIAAKTVGCRITVSQPPEVDLPVVGLLDQLTDSWAASIEFVEETEEELATRIRSRQTDRVRFADPSRVSPSVRKAAPEVQLYIADAPVFRHGRVELLWYVQEQSLSVNYHRYGNLGTRSDEVRADVL